MAEYQLRSRPVALVTRIAECHLADIRDLTRGREETRRVVKTEKRKEKKKEDEEDGEDEDEYDLLEQPLWSKERPKAAPLLSASGLLGPHRTAQDCLPYPKSLYPSLMPRALFSKYTELWMNSQAKEKRLRKAAVLTDKALTISDYQIPPFRQKKLHSCLCWSHAKEQKTSPQISYDHAVRKRMAEKGTQAVPCTCQEWVSSVEAMYPEG
ncbi:hypothetical protein A6R68_08849, partial [Neotoma lepida]